MESRDETVIETRQCEDLDAEIASLENEGYRLDMIMPADAPREALLSKGDEYLRVISNAETAEHAEEISAISASSALKVSSAWITGRAGMEYRDLIPDRLGGRLIASHIRLKDGGEVPDYVHYHKIRFQMIFCKTGSIRVVYEDQGEPFVLNAGDCVLQPPEIRHRVLESTAGAEVIEISSPAEHETWVEHEIKLPTKTINPDRTFGDQRFVRSIAADAPWNDDGSVQYRDLGIKEASNGFAEVRVIRLRPTSEQTATGSRFIFVLNGEVEIPFAGETKRLAEGDSLLLPADLESKIRALTESELLEIRL